MVNVKIELPLLQVDIILKGLGELQAKESYPIIKAIHDQVKPQIEVEPTKE